MRFLVLLLRAVMALGVLAGLLRCDVTDTSEPQSLVVETFLRTNRPLPTVTLRQTRSLSQPADSNADAATGAQVRLVLNDEVVAYEENSQRVGRYRPVSSGRVVPSEVSWQLRVEWNDETARAAGRTPRAIRLTEVCVQVPREPVRAVRLDSLRRDSLDIPTEQTYIYPIDVNLEWQGSDGRSAVDTSRWVRTQLRPDTSQFGSELVSRFLQSVEVRREDRFRRNDAGRRQWTGVYAVPVDTSTSPLPDHRLTTVLVRGDSAFGDFARTQNDADLREPISNVDGGLGIATAIAVDSIAHGVTSAGTHCRQATSGGVLGGSS